MSYLTELVLAKVRSLPSSEAAAAFFEVSEALVAQWEKGSKAVSLAAVEKVFDPGAMPGMEMVEEARWEGKSVCLMMPSYKTSNPRTTFALMSMLDRTKMAVMLDFGDAFIAHSRNKLGDNFLKTNIEWAFTVDDDMIVPFGNAQLFNTFTRFDFPPASAGLHTINRLLSHGKSLVGGLYFGRWAHGKPVYAEGAEDKIEEAYARRAPHNVCKPTKWVGTGCLLIHRTVFLAIEKRFPHLARNSKGDYGHWFTSSEHDLKDATEKALSILNDDATSEAARITEAKKLIIYGREQSRWHSGLGMGEDVTFCVRARQSGHIPHVDLGVVCGHVGDKCYGPRPTN
jgi:hypothetical protein